MRRTVYEDTHEEFRSSVRSFLAREVAPHFERWERAGIVDRAMYHAAGDVGLMGLTMPEIYGGGGPAGLYFETVAEEEYGRSGMLGALQGIMNHNVSLACISNVASPAQQERWYPDLVSGRTLAAVAMTEPGTGSDLSAVSTRAVRQGDGFVLNGAKTFITSAMTAELVVVVCKTGRDDERHHNMSLLVVEAGMAGFTRGRKLDKVGQHSADTGELFFDDVWVPEENLLGVEGEAFLHLMGSLPRERLNIAVVAIAHAEGAFQSTLDYAKNRIAFGQPIASFQNSRFELATMRTELDLGQVYLDRQLDALVSGELTAEEAAQAKWWCTDLNRRVLDRCLQLHGGYGYMEEYPIARAWRDGRAMSIYGGSNEIMKELIGRRRLGV